jgi:UPF0755 protein
MQSPYNTYLHYGLPPTPIASPGLAAWHAALHPDETRTLYFAARAHGSGSHVFSDNLYAHTAIIKKYIIKK